MCETWESIDSIVDRLMKGLEAAPATGLGGGPARAAARAGEGRAHNAGRRNGVVIEFGKRPGTEAPGKVSVRGYPRGGGRSPWITNTGRPSRCGIVRRTKL